MSRIVGIDLGTTNSLVAYVDEQTGLPRVIPDADGHALLPSIVAFTPGRHPGRGEAARAAARRAGPRDTVYSVKRFMGRGYDDVKDELALPPVHGAAGRGHREARSRRPRGHAARGVGDRAQGAQGARRGALRRADREGRDHGARLLQRQPAPGDARTPAASPGSTCVRIVNEPTAASLAYGLHRLERGRGRRLRPRRRHVRHLDPAREGRHLRGPGDQRQHASRRRRLRPRDRAVAARGHPGPPRRRADATRRPGATRGHAGASAGRRGGQDPAVGRGAHRR